VNKFDPKNFKDVAAECPGFQARVTARAITRYYNACFKPLGLTAEQFSLLVGVGTNPGTTLIDLALSSGVDATTLSRNIQNLELRELVRAEGGRGRSGKRLNLSPAGQDLLMKAFPVWKSAKTELSHQMGSEQLVTTTQIMAELAKAAALAQDSNISQA